MDNNLDIKALLLKEFPDCTINVSGQGCNFTIEITGEIFEAKNRVQRQRLVNNVLKNHLESGTIHAVSIIAKAPGE